MTNGEVLEEAIARKFGHGGRQRLAELVGRDRNTIYNWTQAKGWPEILEPLLEQHLSLPPAFFAVARGSASYEAALTLCRRRIADTGLDLQLLAKLQHLLSADPTRKAGSLSMAEVQRQLRQHIELLYKMAMPDGQVTSEGIQTARTLLRARD